MLTLQLYPGLRKYYADLLLLCNTAQQVDSHISYKTPFVAKTSKRTANIFDFLEF